MYQSPSKLPEETRRKVSESLNQRLADGLDLHGQIKAADTDTVDLLTGIITEFEKHAWFLRASLDA